MYEAPTSPFAPGTWRARWIWAAPDGDQGPVGRHSVAIRRDVEIDEIPAGAWMRLFSNSRHIVWVNGVEVAHGPVRSNPRDGRYDLVELSEVLRPGRNRFAVLATCYRQATPWHLPPPEVANDLAGGAFVAELLLGDDLVTTDRSWQATALHGGGRPRAGASRVAAPNRSSPRRCPPAGPPATWTGRRRSNDGR